MKFNPEHCLQIIRKLTLNKKWKLYMKFIDYVKLKEMNLRNIELDRYDLISNPMWKNVDLIATKNEIESSIINYAGKPIIFIQMNKTNYSIIFYQLNPNGNSLILMNKPFQTPNRFCYELLKMKTFSKLETKNNNELKRIIEIANEEMKKGNERLNQVAIFQGNIIQEIDKKFDINCTERLE